MHNFDCVDEEDQLHASYEDVRAWLKQVMEATGLKPTPFARKAGLSPSTILRALDEKNGTSLERQSIAKIVEKLGVPGPAGNDPIAGFREPDLAEYTADPVRRLLPNEYQRILQTRVLDLIGYVPGDLLTFNMASVPAPGDVVEAQKYAPGLVSAETVLRYYDPPYLTVRSTDPAIDSRPLLVDNQSVRIVAVCTELHRTLKTA